MAATARNGTTGLAANDPPALSIIRIADLPEFLDKELRMDLKPFVDRNAFPKLAIASYTHNGGIYGMPDNGVSRAIVYNQDMIEEASGTVPIPQWDDPAWTVDDFFNAREARCPRQHPAIRLPGHGLECGLADPGVHFWRATGKGSVLAHGMHPERAGSCGRAAIPC